MHFTSSPLHQRTRVSLLELFRWQWNGYSTYHRSRKNLLLHIVFVPLFLTANIGLLFAIIAHSWILGFVSIPTMGIAIALQGHGHRQENIPPEQFTSPLNAIFRIFLEQWINFPRFVISGGWSRAMRQSISG